MAGVCNNDNPCFFPDFTVVTSPLSDTCQSFIPDFSQQAVFLSTDCNPCENCSLFGRVAENWQEGVMLAAVVLTVVMAVSAFFGGLFLHFLACLAVSLVLLFGASLVSQLPTFEQLRDNVQILQAHNKTLSTQISEISSAAKALKQQISGLDVQNTRFDKQNTRLESSVGTLGGQCTNIISGCGEILSSLSQKQTELQEYISSIISDQKVIERTQKLAELDSKLQETTQTLEQFKLQASHLQKQLSQLNEDLEKKRKQNTALEKRNEQLNEQMSETFDKGMTQIKNFVKIRSEGFILKSGEKSSLDMPPYNPNHAAKREERKINSEGTKVTE